MGVRGAGGGERVVRVEKSCEVGEQCVSVGNCVRKGKG